MPYKDEEQSREAARLRKQKQRSHPNVTPLNVTPKPPDDVTPLTHLGLTVESMYPSELDIYNRHGIDIRTMVYNRLLAEQRG